MKEMDEDSGSLPQVYHLTPTSLSASALASNPRVRGYVIVAHYSYVAAGGSDEMVSSPVPGRKTAPQPAKKTYLHPSTTGCYDVIRHSVPRSLVQLAIVSVTEKHK